MSKRHKGHGAGEDKPAPLHLEDVEKQEYEDDWRLMWVIIPIVVVVLGLVKLMLWWLPRAPYNLP